MVAIWNIFLLHILMTLGISPLTKVVQIDENLLYYKNFKASEAVTLSKKFLTSVHRLDARVQPGSEITLSIDRKHENVPISVDSIGACNSPIPGILCHGVRGQDKGVIQAGDCSVQLVDKIVHKDFTTVILSVSKQEKKEVFFLNVKGDRLRCIAKVAYINDVVNRTAYTLYRKNKTFHFKEKTDTGDNEFPDEVVRQFMQRGIDPDIDISFTNFQFTKEGYLQIIAKGKI